MMQCAVDQRQRVQSAARALRDQGAVVAVDALEPAEAPADVWSLDILLDRHACGVPAPVLSELAGRNLALVDIEHQTPYWQALATA